MVDLLSREKQKSRLNVVSEFLCSRLNSKRVRTGGSWELHQAGRQGKEESFRMQNLAKDAITLFPPPSLPQTTLRRASPLTDT